MSSRLPKWMPALPSDWKAATIDELAIRVGSGITPTGGSDVYTESGVTFIRSQNVTNEGLSLDDVAFIDRQTHAGMSASEVYPFDVLLNITGSSIGRCCFLPEGIGPTNVNQHVCAIRFPKPDLKDAKFLASVLVSPIGQSQIFRLNAGGNREGLNYQQLRSFRVPWPPKRTRERVAGILTTMDEALEQTEALVAKLQQMKAGLMHDLFTRGVTPDGQLRPTSATRKMKFGWIPNAWRTGSLLDVASAIRQPILTGPFGADLGNDDFVAEGVPVLRIGNVQAGHLDLNDLLYVSEIKARTLERYKVHEGDLLFARQGATTGRNALASEEVAGWLINYHIIRVALDHTLCSPLFIEAAFNGEVVKRQVERDKGRGTREGINSAQLKALALPLADFDEQQHITRILKAHEAQLHNSQTALVKLRQQKQGLMQDLLTGRVPVTTS